MSKKKKYEICNRKARRLKRRRAQGRGLNKVVLIDEFHLSLKPLLKFNMTCLKSSTPKNEIQMKSI